MLVEARRTPDAAGVPNDAQVARVEAVSSSSTPNLKLLRTAERIAAKTYGGRWTAAARREVAA